MQYEFNKVAGALASCDHQKSKLRAVAGAELCWVAELRVRQLKIGRKSCFGYLDPLNYTFILKKFLPFLLDSPVKNS